MSRVRVALLASLAAALVAVPAHAKKNKVQHTNVVAPTWGQDIAGLDVGIPTYLKADEGALWVAGTTGIARVASDGSVTWQTQLPPTAVRGLDVANGVVAWTGFSVAGVSPSEGFQKFVMGNLGNSVTVEGASVGALDAATGAEKWVIVSDEQSTLSPPAVSSISVGVTRARSFAAYDLASGAELGRYDLKGVGVNSNFFAGVFDQAPRVVPLVTDDSFYTGFFSHLIKLDHQGRFVEKSWGNGLTPYVNITCGPIVLGGDVVLGSTGDSNVDGAIFGVKQKNLKGTFREWLPDQQSGCSSAIVDGDSAILATNFYVMELTDKGKLGWMSVNRKGGLYPSSNRGLRFVSNFPVRKSINELVTVVAGKVWVATDNGKDVITVLDRKSGAYVHTVDVNQTIVALAPFGDRLAVATPTGVKVLETK